MPSGTSSLFWLLLALEIAALALASFLGCRALEPLAAAWKLWDPPSGRKDHERPVLFTGGLLFAICALAAAGFLLTSEQASPSLVLLLTGGLLATSVGFVDDFLKSRGRDLAAIWKLLGQIAASALALAGGIELRLFGEPAVNVAATLLWLIAVQNAWNFLDNMNGLATGLAATVALAFTAVFANLGAPNLALASAAIAGICLGFLPQNFPLARAFLGDAGTGCLGYSFAVLAVAGTYVVPEGPGLVAVAVPIAVLSIPLFDMAQVLVARVLARQPLYRGDHRHLSHRLANQFGSRKKAVLVLLGAGFLLGMVSVFVPHASAGMAWSCVGFQGTLFLGLLLFALR